MVDAGEEINEARVCHSDANTLLTIWVVGPRIPPRPRPGSSAEADEM